MKKRVILSLVVLVTLQVSLSLGGPPLLSGQPYVSMSITPGMFDLGIIPRPGSHDLQATLTLHIIANCPYHVEVSLEPFIRAGSGSIPLDRTSVQMVTPISSPVGTPIAGEDVGVELNFNIETTFQDLPGTYTGTVTFTIMEGP
jgi:hypothetical protein